MGKPTLATENTEGTEVRSQEPEVRRREKTLATKRHKKHKKKSEWQKFKEAEKRLATEDFSFSIYDLRFTIANDRQLNLPWITQITQILFWPRRHKEK